MSRGQTFVTVLVLIVLVALWYEKADQIKTAFKQMNDAKASAK